MSNLRLVMRGECEPAAAGCSRASVLGPGSAVLPLPGELGLFSISFPLFWLFFFFLHRICSVALTICWAVGKVLCLRCWEAGHSCAVLGASVALAHLGNAEPRGELLQGKLRHGVLRDQCDPPLSA